MRFSLRISLIVTPLCVVSLGCEPHSTTPTNPKSSTVANATDTESGQPSAESPDTTPPRLTVQNEANNSVAASTAERSDAPPTTVSDAIRHIDLAALPRLKHKQIWTEDATSLAYTCESSLKAVDAFYRAELESRGWVEQPSLVTPTDVYVDRNYTKQDFVAHFNASESGSLGETVVTIHQLGNIDVRKLPKPKNRKQNAAPSTPSNVTYTTDGEIAETLEELSKEMLDSGWQPCVDFQASPNDVPHFRSARFRKQAVRVNLGCVRVPQGPTEETTVFYHAEPILSFDVPTVNTRLPLKVDLIQGRTSFEFDGDRSAMVKLFQSHADSFGWKLQDVEAFEAKEKHALRISCDRAFDLAARLVESKGIMSISLEKIAKKQDKPTNDSLPKDEAANSTVETAQVPMKVNDKAFQALQAEIDATIASELSKALSDINGDKSVNGGKTVPLDELKAKADRLMKDLQSLESEPESSLTTEGNPFDVPDDKEPIAAADKAITANGCKIQHGADSYTLRHVVAYTMMENGKPSKRLIFANSAIDESKLRNLLAKGESVYGTDVAESPCIAIHVWGDSVSINAMLGSVSLATNADALKSSLRYQGGKLIGRIQSQQPLKIGDKEFEVAIELNQPVLKLSHQ